MSMLHLQLYIAHGAVSEKWCWVSAVCNTLNSFSLTEVQVANEASRHREHIRRLPHFISTLTLRQTQHLGPRRRPEQPGSLAQQPSSRRVSCGSGAPARRSPTRHSSSAGDFVDSEAEPTVRRQPSPAQWPPSDRRPAAGSSWRYPSDDRRSPGRWAHLRNLWN